MFRDYLPVPPTRFVRGRLGSFLVVQRYVKGAVLLRQVSDAQLAVPAVSAPLRGLLAQIAMCYAQTGWMPDVGGRVYVPGELYDVRRTDNLVLGADGRWWLVDVGATALFHHRKWPTGWLHTRFLMAAVRRFDRKLAQQHADVDEASRAPGMRMHASG